MKDYNHLRIEKKWQKRWEKDGVYKASNKSKKEKFYVLDMFPYPSGAGLHVGHPRGYIASDVFSRYKRMQGFNVLHPMGFDSFGLPAEQYAIKTGKHPGPFTESLIKRYKTQLKSILFSYDWDREVATHRPEYYKWTQWIFLRLYEHYYDTNQDKAVPIKDLVKDFEKNGNKKTKAVCTSNTPIITAKEWADFSDVEKQNFLMNYRIAYEGYAQVNWCEELGTVLANDEIVTNEDGTLVSERGGHPVVRKDMRQWFMRITAYADRLLAGLEEINWSNSIKEVQKNWIGKSEGAEIDFPVKDSQEKIKVFTTRADTIYGATYVVVAPEHALIQKLKDQISNYDEVEKYVEKVKARSEIERTDESKAKTGVELQGVEVENPANGKKLSVWVADYVLVNYGTGAIMAVPQHDERDREFAVKYNLPIVDEPLVKIKEVVKKVKGTIVTRYKMRDAIFARQRYWGEPIPLVHTEDGLIKKLPNKDLPLELPKVKSYEPTGTGESPLAGVKSWKKEGYETNTMPGWAGSSWYFLRYMDSENKNAIASKSAIEYWQNVDMYVGGTEHATGHLLYARFWHKFLKDIGVVGTEEPFKTLKNQGMILAEDGRKMSKRWGNVVNPDEVIANHGADTMRLYEMFMGPFEASQPWSTDSIVGARRFVERVWRLGMDVMKKTESQTDEKVKKTLHKTIKKVTKDINDFSFNTSVSAMMIWLNEAEKKKTSVNDFSDFLKILAPFAPAVSEELWHKFGNKNSIHLADWPKWDEGLVVDEEATVVIQVNGKRRGEMIVSTDVTQAEVETLALANENIIKFTEGKKPKRVVYVKGRLINIVV